MVEYFLWVSLCTSPLGACGDLSLVIGLETKRSGNTASWGEEALSCMATGFRKSHYSFSGITQLIPSTGSGKARTTGGGMLLPLGWKGHFCWGQGSYFQWGGETTSTQGRETSYTSREDSSEFRGSMSPTSSGSSHVWELTGSDHFPIHTLTFPLDALQRWEFNIHCNWASPWTRLCIGFSAISALHLLEIRVSFRAQTEAFRSFIQCLSWEFKSLSSSTSFTTLFRS